MVFNMNQFGLTFQPGEKMNPNGQAISVRISANESATLVPGDVVEFTPTEAGDLPVVDKAESGDSGCGVILFNAKQGTFVANDVCEIAMLGSIVTMAAATNLNRGINVGYNSVSGYIQSTSGNYIGQTIDIASATGDIVRVLVSPKLS